MSKYYDPSDKFVYDGAVAEAQDLNDINTSTSAGFDLVEADLALLGNVGKVWSDLSKSWAVGFGEIEPGLYSSKTYSENAEESALKAKAAEDAAALVESNVLLAEQNSANCAAESTASAGASDQSRIDAETAENGAKTAEAGSEAARDLSRTYRDQSDAWSKESEAWANTPEDVQVPNYSGQYSAFHWAKKAAIAAGGGVMGLRVTAPITINNVDPANPIVGWGGDKTDVGLGNVDNTSDLNKPISNATQAALDQLSAVADGKVGAVFANYPLEVDNTNPAAPVFSFVGNKGDVGLGAVDNTSDADKPVSTAQQAALDLKEDDLGTPAADGMLLTGNADGTRMWADAPEALPPGGTTNQVLSKNSPTDGDVGWKDPTGASEVAHGSANYTGDSGETAIPHGMSGVPTHVTITTTENPGGYLGEIWCRKDATNIYVGNSGSFVGGFDWRAILV